MRMRLAGSSLMRPLDACWQWSITLNALGKGQVGLKALQFGCQTHEVMRCWIEEISRAKLGGAMPPMAPAAAAATTAAGLYGSRVSGGAAAQMPPLLPFLAAQQPAPCTHTPFGAPSAASPLGMMDTPPRMPAPASSSRGTSAFAALQARRAAGPSARTGGVSSSSGSSGEQRLRSSLGSHAAPPSITPPPAAPLRALPSPTPRANASTQGSLGSKPMVTPPRPAPGHTASAVKRPVPPGRNGPLSTVPE